MSEVKIKYTLVCGSREGVSAVVFPVVFPALDKFHAAFGIEHVLAGRAPGVDSAAQNWALDRSIAVTVIPAEWAKYGKAAGPIRNRRMLTFEPIRVLAFAGGRGTANMIAAAREARVPVHFWNGFTEGWTLG